jgi:hypothetical protein
MNRDELTRIRSDIDSIESAMGLSRRDPQEFRLNVLLAAAGLAALIWSLIPHGLSPLLGLISFAVPVTAWLRLSTTRAEPFRAREFQSAARTLWLALPLLGLFAWCRQSGLAPIQFLGLAIFLIGSILFAASAGEKQGRSFIGWGLALMVGGLIIPLQVAQVVVVFALAIVAGSAISALLTLLAREEATGHAAG